MIWKNFERNFARNYVKNWFFFQIILYYSQSIQIIIGPSSGRTIILSSNCIKLKIDWFLIPCGHSADPLWTFCCPLPPLIVHIVIECPTLTSKMLMNHKCIVLESSRKQTRNPLYRQVFLIIGQMTIFHRRLQGP